MLNFRKKKCYVTLELPPRPITELTVQRLIRIIASTVGQLKSQVGYGPAAGSSVRPT